MQSAESFEQVFQFVKDICKENVSNIAYSLWIKDIEAVRLEDSKAYIKVKNQFKKNVVEGQYLDILSSAFDEALGFSVDIMVEIEEETTAIVIDEPVLGEYEYTFGTFIVGSSNKFAHAAAQAVASNPSNAYNPLFIYGDSGLGKTHLLYAIWGEINKSMPNKKVVTVNGETFTNELIEAIRHESTKAFHDKYRLADVLLVDDIQFIGGKESTQEEFFHTFNSLYQDNKQIVLTSDRPPKEIKTLEERLRTRFEWGLIADIQPPDFETRTAIIRRKAQLLGLEMPTEISDYIASKLKSNIRQLEGVVKKLKAMQLLNNTPMSVLIAQEAIRDILTDDQPLPVTIDRIISEVARTYNVSAADIRSSKRSAGISGARQIAAYVIKEITQISLNLIGDELGGRDHSTIVYAVRQVEKNMIKDPHYKETVNDIIKNIRSK